MPGGMDGPAGLAPPGSSYCPAGRAHRSYTTRMRLWRIPAEAAVIHRR